METYIEQFGYLAILLGTFLEGETVLILGGFAAHRGYLDLFWVIFTAFVGTVSGDQLFYSLGRRHSQALLAHRPAWQPRIEKAQGLIARHRLLIILSFRFVYGLRTVIPFTLGVTHVSARVFVPLNLLGALIWSVGIGCAGFLFGQALETLLGRLKQVELWIMLGIAVVGGVVWLVHFFHSRRKAF